MAFTVNHDCRRLQLIVSEVVCICRAAVFAVPSIFLTDSSCYFSQKYSWERNRSLYHCGRVDASDHTVQYYSLYHSLSYNTVTGPETQHLPVRDTVLSGRIHQHRPSRDIVLRAGSLAVLSAE